MRIPHSAKLASTFAVSACALALVFGLGQTIVAEEAPVQKNNAAAVPPGVVIAHSPASSGNYIGSAGLAVLHDGTYLAKHDDFGPKSTEHVSGVTRIYRSTDHGKTWSPLSTIDGLFWSNIFEHRCNVCMIGTHHHHGSLVVYKSSDGGKSWSTPSSKTDGLIRPGKWHTAPVPIVEHGGRLWRAVEDGDGPAGWGQMYRPRVMSIAVDGNLLNADEWTITNPIERDGGWLGGTYWCVLEGNAIVDRVGTVRNMLRSDLDTTAAVATVSRDGRALLIDPAFDHAMLPGSSKKLLIRWDEASNVYWALSNPPLSSDGSRPPDKSRNTLALYRSPDLRQWTLSAVLLQHPDFKKHAFQYPDFLIEGDDLLVASRTAYDDGVGGAHTAHDANYLTFHRFQNLHKLVPPSDGSAK